MAGIGDRVKRLEEQVAELTARAQAEDDGLAAEVNDTEPEQQEPVRKQCAAVGCGDGVGLLGRYCPAHQRLLALCDDAITETRRAIATADSAADPFGWETSLQSLLQARRAIVGPEAQPAPVATVGVKCPKCGGGGRFFLTTDANHQRVGEYDCPACLGAGIVHTHADYQRIAQELDLYRRALIAACHDIGFGQADVDGFLAVAAREAEGNE